MFQHLDYSEIDFSELYSRNFWCKYVPEIGLCIGYHNMCGDDIKPVIYKKDIDSPWLVYEKDMEFRLISELQEFQMRVTYFICEEERSRLFDRPMSRETQFEFGFETEDQGETFFSRLYPELKFTSIPSPKEFIERLVKDVEHDTEVYFTSLPNHPFTT